MTTTNTAECWRCHELLAKVPSVCRNCHARNQAPGEVLAKSTKRVVENKPRFMEAAELVGVMEERWLLMQRRQARVKAEMAVGLRFRVFKRDNFRCHYCGRSADEGAVLQVDHVVPKSKGGVTSIENLATSCVECNLGKSNQDVALS